MSSNQNRFFIGGSIILLVAVFAAVLLGGWWVINQQPQYDSNYRAMQSADPLVTKISGPELTTKPVVLPSDFIRGDEKAPVTMVVFSDFACPYCRELSSTLTQIVTNFPSVRLVWKDYPIPALHPDAMIAHVGAHCAGEQNKFWEFHDALFAQDQNFDRDRILKIAQDLRLQPTKFASCLDSEDTSAKVKINVSQGNALQIDGTPYVFVNDQRLSGVMSYEDLAASIKFHVEAAAAKK